MTCDYCNTISDGAKCGYCGAPRTAPAHAAPIRWCPHTSANNRRSNALTMECDECHEQWTEAQIQACGGFEYWGMGLIARRESMGWYSR